MKNSSYNRALVWILLAVLLTVVSSGIGLVFTEQSNRESQTQVSHIQQKLGLARMMRDTATDRLAYLQFILISDDPFLQDEWSMEHARLGSQFSAARERLVEGGLSDEEKGKLDEALYIIRLAAESQNEIRAKATQGKIDEAKKMLSSDSFAIRTHLVQKLDDLEHYYEQMLDAATSQAQARGVLASRVLFSLTALILVLISMFGFKVARRIWRQDQYLHQEIAHRRRVQLDLEEHQAMLELKVEQRTSALRHSEDRLRAILDTAPEAVITIDQNGNICSINPAAESTFGYLCDELTGEPFARLLEPGYRQAQTQAMQSYLETGEAGMIGKSVEVGGLRKDGTAFPLELKIGVVRMEDDTLFTGMMHDISERKALQSQLIQAQKLESVGQLAAGIAHEINTPIQYITDNTVFLQESIAALAELAAANDRCLMLLHNSEAKDSSASIEDSIDKLDIGFLLEESPKALQQSLEGLHRVANIVGAMKEFSHPGTHAPEQVDINRLIESTLTISRNEWKYVAEFVLFLQQDLPSMTGYHDRLGQVLINLIINAAHAIAGKGSGEKGLITISTHSEHGNIVIKVADSGTGVPVQIRNRIFDPFFTTKGVGKGTGQGLAIAHSVIVDQHHGTLTLGSDISGGAEFSITLPVKQTEQREAA